MTGAPREALRPRSPAVRRFKERAFISLCAGASGLLVLTLAVLIGSVLISGWSHLDWRFLSSFPSRKAAEAGVLPALAGTAWLCGICAITALPLGVAAAVFLEEYRPRSGWAARLHRFVQINIQNLAGVPSIVYGIIGLTVFVRCFGLLGSPNESMYDRIARFTLASGQVIAGRIAEETADSIAVDRPVEGLITLDPKLVTDREIRLVREHVFTLSDGSTIRGQWLSTDRQGIHVRPEGAEPRTISSASVTAYDSTRMLRLGDPETPFYLRLPFGDSLLSGGLTLALVILPIIIIASQEALRGVPDSLRQGAFAAGATRWQMIRRLILPAAVPGIMTGAILAVSRAIGEAAPILIVGGVLSIRFVPKNLMDSIAAMPLQIYNWAGRPQDDFRELAAAAIIVLLAALLVFNAGAIMIRQLTQKPLQ